MCQGQLQDAVGAVLLLRCLVLCATHAPEYGALGRLLASRTRDALQSVSRAP